MVEQVNNFGSSSATDSVGLYVHIPWCRAICTYCDFDRQAHAFELIPSYVAALVADVRRQPSSRVHSVFFGGGTPSLLEPPQIRAVLDAIRQHFSVLPSAEITVEANPGDLDGQRVSDYLAAGVNRLSLGIQTLDDQLLRLLGRRHSAATAVSAVQQARAGGATNLSIDLMLALPGQSPAHWRDTLSRAIALEPEHFSAYLLTIDERVPLGRQVRRGALSLPVDDEVVEMYEDAQRLLGSAGYEQYEISNWARPGRESRHNLTYWRDEPYLGLGAGAASSYAGRRWKVAPDPAAYIRGVEVGAIPLVEDERTDTCTAALDCIALGLRLRQGLNLDRLRQRFGIDMSRVLGEELADLERAGVLERQNPFIRVAVTHITVTNEITLRLHDAIQRHAPALWPTDAARSQSTWQDNLSAAVNPSIPSE